MRLTKRLKFYLHLKVSDMKNNKADISMNMIVYIAIALLILVLVVGFVTGGFGQMFSGLSKTAPQELDSIQSRCASDCSKAEITVEQRGTSAWESTSYCTTRYKYDLDQSGDIGQNEYFACWQSPVSVDCSTSTRGYKQVQTPIPDSSGCQPTSDPQRWSTYAGGISRCRWTATYRTDTQEQVITCDSSKCEAGC